VPFGHTLIGLKSLKKGLSKIKVNAAQLSKDLDENWAVVAEAIQTILRREGYPDPYRLLKEATRTGAEISQETLAKLIDELEGVSAEVKDELRSITPHNFTGLPLTLP
jgi:adenylosuccinate lyase